MKYSSRDSTVDGIFQVCDPIEDQTTTQRTIETQADFETNIDTRIQEQLDGIFWIDDLDLMNIDDITDADFIHKFLCYVCPSEFEYQNLDYFQNRYICILYQLKSFLESRNFKVANYLK